MESAAKSIALFGSRAQTGTRAGEQVDARIDRNEVDAVAGRRFELRRRNGFVRPARLLGVEARESRRLPPQVGPRAAEGVRREQLERDRSGDEPKDDHPGEEQGRKLEAQ